MDFKENVIEWITGSDQATLSLSQKRTITRAKKLAEQYPDEVQIVAENEDGSVCVHMPVNYIRFNRPMELSEEEKARRAQFLRDGRARNEQIHEEDAEGEETLVEEENE